MRFETRDKPIIIRESEKKELRRCIAEKFIDLVYMDADKWAGEAIKKFQQEYIGYNEGDDIIIQASICFSYGTILSMIGNMRRKK